MAHRNQKIAEVENFFFCPATAIYKPKRKVPTFQICKLAFNAFSGAVERL